MMQYTPLLSGILIAGLLTSGQAQAGNRWLEEHTQKSLQPGGWLAEQSKRYDCQFTGGNYCGRRYVPPKPTRGSINDLLKRALKEMVHVKGGEFIMGCDTDSDTLREKLPQNILDYIASPRAGEPGQQFYFHTSFKCAPRHKVTLDGYNIARFEISWADFDLYTQVENLPFVKPVLLDLMSAPEYTRGKRTHKNRVGYRAANLGWHQANRYCAWLAEKTGLPFALPTEAQWEFAATSRGRYVPYATDTGYWNRGVNYYTTDEEDYIDVKKPKYPPNALGLYDMSGSANEWVSDWYAEYTEEPQHNPKGPPTGTHKIAKGSTWAGSPDHNANWMRGPRKILLSERDMRRKRNRHQAPQPEDAKRLGEGARCALNLDRPITQEDIDKISLW